MILVTGHRPQRIPQFSLTRLTDLAKAALVKYMPELIITGMAQGWDTACAVACNELEIPYICAIPHVAQFAGWPAEDEERWVFLCSRSQSNQVIGDWRKGRQTYLDRNRWMVNQEPELVLALWDGQRYGGTWHTVQYATAKNVKVINLWQSWLRGAEQ